MSRNPATWALLLVLAAWVSRSPQGNTGQIASASTKPQVPQASGGSSESKGAQLLRRHLALKGPTTDEQLRAALVERGDRLKVLLATLPHPRASHLDWAFDTHLDSIRRAFERAGFVLEEYFLPWREPAASVEDHQSPHQPGVLLFRGLPREFSTNAKTRLWLVYLVPEISTGGIDKQAFSAALTERALLLPQQSNPKAPSPDLLIVGPVLSGSAYSLRTALDAAEEDPSSGLAGAHIRVVSGAATSPKNRSVLAPPADKRTTFESTLHTDDVLQRVLRERVLPELGIREEQLAVLQEANTAYGNEFSERAGKGQEQSGQPGPGQREPPTDHFLRVPFPMSLASLRTAAIATPEDDGGETSAPGRTASTQTKFDLSDAPRPRETVPAASGLTPASIDILLEETARMLGKRGIKAVLLVATDVRDKLFLGRELKRRLPNLQLFTTEGNVLYLRPEYNAWLRGMLVVSTYPILLRDPAWRPQSSDGQQYAFANEGAEGTFNAVLVQLGRLDVLADYGHPLREPRMTDAGGPILERPPVWLTAVGAGTMLPVAVYDPSTDLPTATSADPAADSQLTEAAVGNRGGAPSGVRARQSLVGLLAVFGTALLSLVLIAVAGVGERRAGKLEALAPVRLQMSWENRQRQMERVSLQIHRESFVLSRYLALAGLLLPNVVLIDLLALQGSLPNILVGALATFAIICGGRGVCLRSWRVVQVLWVHGLPGIKHAWSADWPTPTEQRAWKAEIVLRGLSLLLAPAYMALTLLVCGAILRTYASSDPTRYALFFNRAIEIDEGISPLLPLMLLGVTLLAWTTWHVQRVRMLGAKEPAQDLIDRGSMGRAGEVWMRLFQAMPEPRGVWVASAIAVGGLWLVVRFEPTPESLCLDRVLWFAPFDRVLALGIAGSLGASIWAAYRLVSVWTACAQALAHAAPWVEALPFRDLAEKVGLKPSLGLWPSTGTRELTPFARDRWSKLRTLGVPANEDAGVHSELLGRIRVLAGCRSEQLGEHAKPTAGSRSTPAWVLLARELIAIEVLLYVEWSLRHLRLLCVFLLISLVLTTILVSSYPIRPGEAQNLALFVFAGVVVVLVWLIGSLSRDPALSRMTGTTPGQLTWDRTLYTNLGLYALVPTITLLSSQFPALRAMLLDWIRPMMDSLVRG